MTVEPGTQSKSVTVQVVDDAGQPVVGLDHTTFPPTYWDNDGILTDAQVITLSDLGGLGSAYSAGGIKEKSGTSGQYRLDVPNAAWLTAGRVTIFADVSGKHIFEYFDCQYAPAAAILYDDNKRVVRGTTGDTFTVGE